jgi:crossover junction endodeoxyribonuclease RuvC
VRVLACDPGYDRLGVAVLERLDGVDTLIHSACVVTDRSLPLNERLLAVGGALSDALSVYDPNTVALETLFFNRNQKTAIGVAEVRGIIIYLARARGCTVLEYGPQEIKIAVTGYGKSDKSAVTSMVKRLVKNVPPDALDDEYDAIAVGITALAHSRNIRG